MLCIMGETRWRFSAALRLSKAEMYMLPPILLGVAALAYFAYQVVGFLGIGLLGVLVGFIAVQVDLDKEGTIGVGVLHAQQMMARQNATPSERAAMLYVIVGIERRERDHAAVAPACATFS